MIPHLTFRALAAALPSLDAQATLATSMATAHGIGMAMSGKDPKVRRLTRTLTKLAYPNVQEGERTH